MKTLIAILLLASTAAAQTISSIDPASGPASGGTFVHIHGTDLIGFPLLCPALQCSDYVQFGETLAATPVHFTTEIVAIAPPHAAGAVDITVNVAGKAKITIPAAFRYEELSPYDYETILVPIVLGNTMIPGAFGSMWKAELTIHNASSDTLQISATCTVIPPCAQPILVPPQSTVTATPFSPFQESPSDPGKFVFVPRRDIDQVDILLRIQDISRQSQTWGTTIPVARETDFRSIIRLLGVPTDSRFRSALRTYNYLHLNNPIRLRIFDETTGALLVEDSPAKLQINSLMDTYPQIASHDRVRIEVESAATPQAPIWAFVSVTNNETQHVTVIAPSP